MIRSFLSRMILVFLLASPTLCRADLIAGWNFNDATANINSAANTAALFSVDRGSGTMTSTFTSTAITAFGGTVTNAQSGDVAGQALALQEGVITNGVAANAGANLTWTSSTVGFQNIIVSLAIQRTGTGFDSDQFQYSINGRDFISFLSPFTPLASFGTTTPIPAAIQTFDLSGITALANNANAAFRIVFGITSATTPSTAGNNRIDNLAVSGSALTPSAVPAPAAVALLGIGLAVSAIKRRRSSR